MLIGLLFKGKQCHWIAHFFGLTTLYLKYMVVACATTDLIKEKNSLKNWRDKVVRTAIAFYYLFSSFRSNILIQWHGSLVFESRLTLKLAELTFNATIKKILVFSCCVVAEKNFFYLSHDMAIKFASKVYFCVGC